jgi:hypothetical protein
VSHDRRNHRNGYIGMLYDAAEARLFRALFSAAGIVISVRKVVRPWPYRCYPEGSWGMYCSPRDVLRARELKRGFKTALALRGNPRDFMLGLLAGMNVRTGRAIPDAMLQLRARALLLKGEWKA